MKKVFIDSLGRRQRGPRTKEEWLDAIQHSKTSNSGLPYDYSPIKATHIKSTDRITYICPDHGIQTVYAFSHLTCRCNWCGREVGAVSKRGKPNWRRFSLAEAIKKAKIRFPKLDYSRVKSYDPKGTWELGCAQHGFYQQSVRGLLWDNRTDCPGCRQAAKLVASQYLSNSKRSVFNKAVDFLGYEVIRYTRSHSPVILRCPEHGKFRVSLAYTVGQGTICPSCRKGSSSTEVKLKIRLLRVIKTVHLHRRDLIKGRELDIYLPKYKVAIEVNGIRFHNDLMKTKHYHLDKTESAEALGICLLHFTDIEIRQKSDLIISMILAKCGIFNTRAGARKTWVREIDYRRARPFLETHHIQGSISGSCYLGLFSKKSDQLCAVAVFGKPRFSRDHEWELLRFATHRGLQIVGGLTKLISAFAVNHTGTLLSYAARSYSFGNVYEAVGFKLVRTTKPSYTWHRGGLCYSRYQVQKHNLGNLLAEYDPGLSEDTNMRNHGFWKVYNSGNRVYSVSLERFRK